MTLHSSRNGMVIPAGVEWSFHSCRNGMVIPFLQERNDSIPFLQEWNDHSIPAKSFTCIWWSSQTAHLMQQCCDIFWVQLYCISSLTFGPQCSHGREIPYELVSLKLSNSAIYHFNADSVLHF